MLPYYIPLGITLLLITYVPALTTWLPRLAMGGPEAVEWRGRLTSMEGAD